MIGKLISHYRITEQIGIGGMGVVYAAEDTRLLRRVAFKCLSDDVTNDAEAVRRFRRTAEIIARLNHPNICTIHDIDEHEGRAFIVMELLEGLNLELFMLKKTLETLEIISVGVQITKALEAAHMASIVHRDIKPGNVFVCNTGLVKVLDFGLARRFRSADIADAPLDGSTNPGRTLGTPNYMVPERFRQMPPDPRSDLFSLGIVLYQMATERLPFAGASPGETVTNILDNDPPLLTSLSPQRPKSLEQVVNTFLATRAYRTLEP